MAAASPAGPRFRSQVELIGRLYLNLWKRLDLIDGDNKWMDVAPPNAQALDEYIDNLRNQMSVQNTNAALHEEAEARYRQARGLIQAGGGAEFGRLKTVLRDEAFRFLDQARQAAN